MKVTSYESTSVQALNESKIDNTKLSNIIESKRDAKREMKRDTATVGISLQLPTAISSNDTIISVDQEIPLWTSGGSSYVWTPDTYLDCSDCDNPISTPGDDIIYFIAVTDSLGCSRGSR